MDIEPYFTSLPPKSANKLNLSHEYSYAHHSNSRSSPFELSSEKLRLSFHKNMLETQVVTIKNRIHKLLTTEQQAVREMAQAKQTAQEIVKKRERNLQKQKEKDLLKQKRLQEKLMLKERVQYERAKRFENIKTLEKELFDERKDVVKRVKAAEKEWKVLAEQGKSLRVEEKNRNRRRLRNEMDLQKKQRCISQMSNRVQVKKSYEDGVSLLKAEQDNVMKKLMALQSEEEIVYKHVSKVLQERNETVKQFEDLITV